MVGQNGGDVRLHSRLFAQRLDYTFPRECLFPRKPGIDGFNGYAEEKEVTVIAASSDHNDSEPPADNTSERMSLWSEEDELLSFPPREERGGLRLCLMLVFAAAVYDSVQSDVPRATLMDLKPGIMNSFCAEAFGQPFNPDHIVSGQTGASNNRMKGHHVESAEPIDSVLDVAKKRDGGPLPPRFPVVPLSRWNWFWYGNAFDAEDP